MPDQRDVKGRMLGALRRWWPVPAILLVALVAQTLFHRLVFGSPSGHAAGHLQSAGAIFFIIAMLAVILWAIPSSKRTLGVWLASALVVLSLLPGAIGNYQVVDALRGTNYSDEEVGVLYGAIPGLKEGHDLAGVGTFPPAIATAVLAFVLWRRKAISLGIGIAAAVLSFVFPPWIIPAFGAVIMAFATCRPVRETLVL